MQTAESIFEKNNIARTYLEAGLYEDAFIIYEDIFGVNNIIY